MDAPVILNATLRPNPPMRARTLLGILMAVCAFNAAFAIYFVFRGAWPVAPFMGADVGILAWAFFASRKAAERAEHITLTPDSLSIQRLAPKRPPEHETLNPYWARVDVQEWGPVVVRAQGRAVSLGAFLGPKDRESFGKTLAAALREAREYRAF